MKRRDFLVAASLPATALAQASWPTRPVRIIVPFGAGGIADLTARTVGEALSKRLDQSVVIDNRPGAGGVVAGETVARAEPDGYTLLLISNGTAVSASLFKRLPFDAQKDFAPISLIGTFDLALIVAANSPIRDLKELFWVAAKKQGRMNIATVAAGSTQNLAAELFKSTAGIKAQVVPFNGTPAVITALRGGEVDAAVEILGPVRSQVEAKALRVLATMGEKRAKSLPDVPTLAESGGALAKFNATSWNGLAAPAKTPRDIVFRLSRDLAAALSLPDVRDKLARLDVQASTSTPEQLGALLASETKRWRDVIERAGIQKQ